MEDRGTALRQLDEFHAEVAAKDAAGQASLLRNGFLPDDAETLIEAGIRCIPLIESEQPAVVDAASDRLAAVVFKLKMAEDSARVRRVLEDFSKLLAERKRSDRSDIRFGLTLVAGLVVLIGGLILLITYLLAK